MKYPSHLPHPACACDRKFGRNAAPSRLSLITLPAVLRRTFVALSIPSVLLLGAAVPAAQPVAVETLPVTATVEVTARSHHEGTLALGTPRSNTQTMGTVTAYALNLRSGPGTGYRVITTASRGTTATVLGQRYGWYNVRLANGTTGWFSGTYFKLGSTLQVAAPTAAGVVAARATMVPNGTFISGWGAPRGGHSHQGEDLAAPRGSAIYAPARLTIQSTGWNTLGGWTVVGRDAKGRRWYFAHLNSRSPVAVGRTVAKGQIIGYVGTTGDAQGTTPHLHYQVTWPGGGYGNPAAVLQSYPDVP